VEDYQHEVISLGGGGFTYIVNSCLCFSNSVAGSCSIHAMQYQHCL